MKRHGPFLACLLLLAGAGAGAQSPAKQAPAKKGAKDTAQEQQALFGETVSVSVVNVDVYVTDKKGNRVTGLTRDDFEIYEDKKPMAITNFFAVQGGKPLAPPAPEPMPVPPEVAAAPEAAPAPAPVPEDQRLRLVVYVDNYNLRPFNRNRALRDLRVFLAEKLGREDQMMLVSYDRSLHVRQAFTSDPGLVNSALAGLEKVTGHAVHQDSDRRDVLQQIEDAKSSTEAMTYARSYAESTFNDLSFSIDALKDIVNGLAGMPGRKAILYVSDGIPMIAGQDVFYAVQSKFGESSVLTQSFEFDASRRFRELTAAANANRITFYTIDAAGLRAYSSISAENQTAGQGVFIDQIEIQNVQSPLQMMAEDTGGMAIINANKIGPLLDRIAADFGTYYSLGYSPPHSGDGRYHEIQVKLKASRGKNLLVRHREGYRDKNSDTLMTDGTLAALNFPYENNALGVELAFGRPASRDDGYYLVPVEVRIPLGKLVLVPHEQVHEASVRLFVAAMDEAGGTSDVQQARVPIRIPTNEVSTAVAKHYTYSMSLLMRRGEQKVAVGLRDDLAGANSFVSRSLRVGAAPAGR